MKYLAMFLFIFFVLSCYKDSYFEKQLTKKDNCWVFIGNYPINYSVNQKTYGGNRFLVNGDVLEILIVNGIEQKNYNFENKNNNYKWRIRNNRILSFYQYNFKILTITKDTMIVENLKFKNKQLFINKPLSHEPPLRKVSKKSKRLS